MERVTRTSSFELGIDPDKAIELFTAEGERVWIPGWMPIYPQEGAVHDAPGTVFLTKYPNSPMTFVVVANGPGRRRKYVRIEEGMTAGFIEVTCEPSERGTTVEVTFDMTALTPEGQEWVANLDADYDGSLAVWKDWIVASVPGA